MRAGKTPVRSARERDSGSSYLYVYQRDCNTAQCCSKLTDDAGERAGGGGVEALGHAAGEIAFAAGDDRIAHGFGHEDGILRFSDGGVHEDAIGAELHGNGGVRGGADAGIPDHGNFRDAFGGDAGGGGILAAQGGGQWRSKKPGGGGAAVNDASGGREVGP